LITIIPAVLTSSVTAIATLKGASGEVAEINKKLEQTSAKADALESDGARVPIGGVVSWWGDWSDANSRPPGYELCDGTSVATARSPIIGREKPKLTGRFIKGASASNANVVASKVSGGVEIVRGLRTELTSITISQMPRHSHGGKTANDGEHTHPTRGRSASDDGGTSADSHFALGDASEERPWPGITIATAGRHSHRLTEEGGGEGHAHVIPDHDIQPPYLEMHFLIRVR